MKRALVAVMLVAAVVGMANAADMPMKAPPSAVAYGWTGFYIGAHVGGGWIRDAGTIGDPLPSPAAYGFERIVIPGDGSGVVGGGQIGYNWQVTPSFLLGIEADFSGSGLKAYGKFGPPIPSIPRGQPYEAGSFGIASRDVDWLASVRGRVGLTWDRVLAYVTGGAAWVKINYSADELFNPGGTVSNPGSLSSTRMGWVAGGGFEYAWTSSWSIRAEYLHYDFDGATFVGNRVPTLPTFGVQYTPDRTQIDVVRAGINYKFGGPIAARY